MKSNNLFHLAIVFFMVVAMVFFGGYEYVFSDLAPSREMLSDIWYDSSELYLTWPVWPAIEASVNDLFNPYPASLTIAPSIIDYQIPIISNWFRPDWSTMLFPEVSPWYRSSALPEYGPQFSIQEQLPSSISDRFYNLSDFTGIDYLYSLGMIRPITRNWNVYQQMDLYVLPASQKYNLYEFTKELSVPMIQPDTWVGYGGYGGR